MVTLQLPAPVSPAAVTPFPDPASLAVRETTPAEPPKPRLLYRVRAALYARHYGRRTEEAYVAWIKRYIFSFHAKRHLAEMGAPEVTRFLSSLVVDGRVAASTRNQALSALLFLYRAVLEVDLPWLDGLVRAKRPHRVPIVLTRDEVRAVLERLEGTPRLMAYLLYGVGLRLLECCRLRVQDVDFGAHQVIVRGGKGDKDRVTMRPKGPAYCRRPYESYSTRRNLARPRTSWPFSDGLRIPISRLLPRESDQALGARSLLVIAWVGSGRDDPNIRIKSFVYGGTGFASVSAACT